MRGCLSFPTNSAADEKSEAQRHATLLNQHAPRLRRLVIQYPNCQFSLHLYHTLKAPQMDVWGHTAERASALAAIIAKCTYCGASDEDDARWFWL